MPKVQLEKMLKKRKMSKYRFAILMKMDQKNVRRIFLPGYDPKFSTLCHWAKVLQCQIKDLYRE